MRKTPLERFMAKVEKTEDGHWFWKGTTLSSGNGQFWDNGAYMSAARFSAEVAGLEIPPGSRAFHKCGIPSCVAPKHLFFPE